MLGNVCKAFNPKYICKYTKKKTLQSLMYMNFFFQKFNRFLKEKKLEIHANNDKYGIASYQYTLLPSYK